MTFRTPEPPPPRSEPPSVLLMRAIGDLHAIEGGEPITDMDAIAALCGMVSVEMPALIEVGIVAGYLEGDDAGGVGLSRRGQAWYERDLLRRD